MTRWHPRRRAVLGLAASTLAAPAALVRAQSQDIRVAHIYSRTGPLEAYGRQTATGFSMGLEYATGGSLAVGGRPLVVTEGDDEGRPDRGRELLDQAYGDGRADLAVGPTSSGVALAMLPVAEARKRILVVEPAVADAITGDKWNRYIFRTGRNSSQDAISNAVVLDQPEVHIATLAQESAFGRDGIAAFKGALARARVVHEEYLGAPAPGAATDFAAAALRLAERLRGLPGRRVVWVLWAGAGNPFVIADELRRHRIEVATGGNTLPAMVQFNRVPGMQGAAYYYYAFSRHPANLWLATQHFLRHGAPPDMFTAGGFAAAMAVVAALRASQGDTAAERLIGVMEGLRFETPKGWMTFRKEDHQALQCMYHFRVPQGAFAGSIPDLKLVREIPAEEMRVPIRNRG